MTDMITIKGIESDMIANNLTPHIPTHPGEVLGEELESRGITQTKFAEQIGMKISLLNELINGKRSFSVEYSLLIEAALGIDADFWLNMQSAYDKALASKNSSFQARLSKIRRIAAVF